MSESHDKENARKMQRAQDDHDNKKKLEAARLTGGKPIAWKNLNPITIYLDIPV